MATARMKEAGATVRMKGDGGIVGQVSLIYNWARTGPSLPASEWFFATEFGQYIDAYSME